jgi:hypothetical protein
MTDKSKAIATCKMPVIAIDQVVDKKRLIGKKVVHGRGGVNIFVNIGTLSCCVYLLHIHLLQLYF